MGKIVSFDINLVPQDPFFASPIGRVLKWALSIGRYIVIFTELIVILSFLTRFSLDRQVTDLNDAINQKKNIILSYGDLESNVRRVQAQTEQYSQIKQQGNIADIFPELTRITPRNITYDELLIRSDKITISGTTLDQLALNNLISNLQLSEKFSSVFVEQIEYSDQGQDQGFNFKVRIELKNAKSGAKT